MARSKIPPNGPAEVLWRGAYEGPKKETSRTIAHNLFFQDIQAYAPDVLRTLVDTPFKVYAQYADRMDPLMLSCMMTGDGSLHVVAGGYPRAIPIRDWASPWGLDTDWCRQRAQATLEDWHWRSVHLGYQPANDSNREWFFDHPGLSEPLGEITITLRPGVESPEDALRRELRAIRKKARKLDMAPIKIPDHMEDYVVWLVRCHVKQWGYQRVLDECFTCKGRVHSANQEAIRIGVLRAAEWVGITFRGLPKGRPKGSQDNNPRNRRWAKKPQ